LVVEERIARQLHEKLLVGVAREMERGLMDPKRVKGLAEAN
jgi:hypothetical protein